ncbi:leucyl aminopeptidase [Bacillus sp. FJAT-47783]|uniref:leucyl aminopeptidase n=1 Tax=Bacillus sp. FJAT-47783 TaxID=2922712 RepID=UPI001FAC13F3|nr:leucyl aminopeptidase [Bacillus sp. FJAT-47783]
MFHIEQALPQHAKMDTVVMGLFHHAQGLSGTIKELNDQLNGELSALIKSGDISTKLLKMTTIFTFGKLPMKRLIIVGLGKQSDYDQEVAKEVFGKVFQTVQADKKEEVVFLLDTFAHENIGSAENAYLLGEAFPLSTYKIKDYKHKSNEPEKHISSITIVTSEDVEKIELQVKEGYVYGKGTNSARTLVNMPSNLLTASELAHYAEQLATTYGFEIEILEKDTMEELGMGGLLAVNQGSALPPKMIVLKYKGKDEWKDVIGLVGKGITYDSGGYSIKPKNSLMNMKTDMAGAAAVLGAMEIIGEMKPKQNVVAVIPATDNMISGSAMTPDHVITTMSGKTVEILNTDAEGRLALADAIFYAKQHQASCIIDVATLTGGVVVALGTHTSGAMTNHEDLFEQVIEASYACGERIWRLPIIDKDRKKVRNSHMADLNNSPGREGHAIMAGAFLEAFADQTPWVHLDIAGTATTSSAGALGPKGATGVMTRTLALFVDQYEPVN